MKLKDIESKLIKITFLFLLVMLINGRSFLGIYLFGFRIGEILTGFSLFLVFVVFFKFKYFRSIFSTGVILSFALLLSYFIFQNFIYSQNFLNLYIYKSSVFIWFLSFLFFGYEIFKRTVVTKTYFILGYIGLAIQYIFNIYYYPSFLTDFFNLYSDKTQFLKGSEIAIFFIVVTFFANKFLNERLFFDIFLIFSSLYIPFMFFKSRSGGFAVFIYILIEIFKKKFYFKQDLKRTFVVLLLSLLLFAGTSHQILGNPFEVEETPAAVEQVFKHKYVVSNTYDDEVPFLYIYENRLYAADGNLNWRLQLWQIVIFDSFNNNNILLGNGFGEKVPIFNIETFSGVDGQNENTHNFFLNVYATGGLISLLILLVLFFNLFRKNLKNFTKQELLIFLMPLFIISMFDGSMENPYFGLVFYFFLGSFYSGINFEKRHQ